MAWRFKLQGKECEKKKKIEMDKGIQRNIENKKCKFKRNDTKFEEIKERERERERERESERERV